MLKLLLSVLVEILVALMIAGLVLAIAIPLLIRYDIAGPGDLTSTIVVTGVLICAVGGMLLRPGSAMNRYVRR